MIDTIAYIVIGIILSFFVGSFWSGVLTFAVMIYLKYVMKRSTPIAYDIPSVLANDKPLSARKTLKATAK